MNSASQAKQIMSIFSARPLLLWITSMICIFYALKFGIFLFTYKFFFLVFCLATSYALVATSLLILSKFAFLFTVVNFGLWVGVFMYDIDINPHLYNSDFVQALLLHLTGFKQLFHLWLILYSGFLFKKGVLK
jgi:hypothetical protein